MVDSMIRLFTQESTVFRSNGLGALPHAASCEVYEERNGEFELEMTYPITGKRYEELSLRRILVAKPNPFTDPQPFRIYHISKPINGLVTVSAQHISYDMSGYTVSPFEANSLSGALQQIKSKSVVTCPFTFWTDKTVNTPMKLSKPASMRSILGGTEGSILDVYGKGEYEFDGFEVKLHLNRGANRGVSIRYGKNLTDLTQDENCQSLYTGVYPFWYTEEDGLVQLPERLVNASGTFDYTRILPLDLTEEYTEPPTEAELRASAQAYISDNNIGVPKVALSVSFIQLSQTANYSEYAVLEEVRLCDTVNISFPKLGVAATAKCISYRYNVLTGKYISVDLGDARTNLATTIVAQSQSISAQKQVLVSETPTKSYMTEAIDNATKLITGGLGGYVVIQSSTPGGYPDEILIMDTDDIQTAVHVWRWNRNGLGYSSTGYNGNYATAITADGRIVADFITTGALNGALIQAGTISAESIRISWNRYTSYIQLEGDALNVYDTSNNVLMSLTSNGQHFYRDGVSVGKMGTNTIGSSDNRGLVFDLEYTGAYMAWAARDTESASTYDVKLLYWHDDAEQDRGLYFYCNTYANGNLYLNSDCHFGFTSAEPEHASLYGGLRFAWSGSTKVDIDPVGDAVKVYNGVDVDLYTDIDMHGYSINNQSDARLKKNIIATTVNGIDVIRSIDLKSFDWIENERHEDIGIIAQQLQQIAPELVKTDPRTGCLSIAESKLVYYCIKALQEMLSDDIADSSRDHWKDPFKMADKKHFQKSLQGGKQPNQEEHPNPLKIYPTRKGD